MKVHDIPWPNIFALTVALGATVFGCNKPVEVQGHLWYPVGDGASLPLQRVDITLWDADGNRLGKYNTSDDGHFVVNFDKDPGQVQYRVDLSSRYFRLLDSCNGSVQSFTGRIDGPFTSPVDEVKIDVVLGPSTEIWTALQDAARTLQPFKRVTDMAQIAVCTGNTNKYNDNDNSIMIKPSSRQLSKTIWHEFGHAVMFWAMRSKLSFTGCQTHQVGKADTPSCAWTEGWADFYALYVNNEVNPGSSPTFQFQNMEIYSSDVVDTDGFKDEGRVAAGLWDMYDQPDDRNNSGNRNKGSTLGDDHNQSSRVGIFNMLQAVEDLAGIDNPHVRTFFKKLVPYLRPWEVSPATSIMKYNYLCTDANKAC